MFKNLKMAKAAKEMRRRFEEAWDSPRAYRPDGFESSEPRRPGIMALDGAANLANRYGMTAGDASILGVEILEAIDAFGSYEQAFDEVVNDVASGQIKTFAGPPLRQFVSAEAVSVILEAVAAAGRYEAYAEYLTTQDNRAT